MLTALIWRKSGGLTRLEEADPALYVEFYGAIRKKKSYFGIILDTLVPLTNFEQAQQIMTGLQEDGVDRIVAKYKGVLKGGMDNGAVLNSSLESKLGGNKGFQKLADWADGHQVGRIRISNFRRSIRDAGAGGPSTSPPKW